MGQKEMLAERFRKARIGFIPAWLVLLAGIAANVPFLLGSLLYLLTAVRL